MCRFLAYSGRPVFLEELVSSPCHSLIHQSLHATETKSGTNGDGFGLGWYGERAEPGVYREIRPAWADENLLSIARQVRSGHFFAHVRAATGTATTRANCHPFAHERHLFMHNGQIGGYGAIKRRLEALIPDALYDARMGTTDSEAIFLLVLGHIAAGRTAGEAFAAALSDAARLCHAAGQRAAIRFAAVLSDGDSMHALRWSSDPKPPTLYLCRKEDAVILASEPVDMNRDCWSLVAPNSLVTVAAGGVRIDPFEIAVPLAA